MYCYTEFKLRYLNNLKLFSVGIKELEKVYFRSQILERPSIGEYWNIFNVPVLPENVIFTFFRTCWCYSEAYNTGTEKWSSIVQYSCTSIWDFKYTFSKELIEPIVLWGKKADGFLLFLKALSSETDLLVTLGDFTVKNTKFGREICI